MINVAVEGESDRAAATAVVEAAGHSVAKLFIARGKNKLDPKIPNYYAAAKRTPWVVFRDSDDQCPVLLRRTLLARITVPNPKFELRIAHTMTEAWLLADQTGFARFFRISRDRMPREPEASAHAKQTLLNLCLKSSLRSIREDVVTSDGMTGPLYVARINEFASTQWDVESAATNSPSLARALIAIRKLSL